MSSRIERLPYDILFFVCTWLNLEDVVHLSYTSRQLNSLLQESTLCRMTVEVRVECLMSSIEDGQVITKRRLTGRTEPSVLQSRGQIDSPARAFQ